MSDDKEKSCNTCKHFSFNLNYSSVICWDCISLSQTLGQDIPNWEPKEEAEDDKEEG